MKTIWLRLSPFYKNVVFGLFIGVLLIGLRDGQWVAGIEELSVDWMMTFYRTAPPSNDTPPFVILDIDNETYQDWGKPLFIPGDKLLALLKFAVKGKPKLIIVDIAFNKQPSPNGLDPDEQALLHFFANYETNHCSQSDCPTIILARAFRLPQAVNTFDSNTKPYYPEQPATFLDKIVMRSTHLEWAATLELSQDRLLRRFSLWTTTCTKGAPDVVPSMPLLTAALLVEDKPNTLPCSCRLRYHLAYFMPVDCQKGPQNWTREELQHKPTEFAASKDVVFHLQPTHLSRRIFYTIPWKKWPFLYDGRALLTIMSAKKMVDKPMSQKPLRDSITLIGSSYVESRNWYTTPLGQMPGTLVLVNSIHSLRQYGVLNAPSPWMVLLVITLLVVLTSWLLVKFGQQRGTIYSALMIIALIPVSLVLFKYGIWLSFVMPWIAIQLRQRVDF